MRICFAWTGRTAVARADAHQRGLVGYWKLAADANDSSPEGNHGVVRGGDFATLFEGQGTFVEVPDHPSLRCERDFSIAALVRMPHQVADSMGDIVSKFDIERRRGIELALVANGSGYNSSSDQRQLTFHTEDGSDGRWSDCGRPGGKSHNSDALTVFNGHLYAGTTDGPSDTDWCRVYRYRGGQSWEDCGRVGRGRTRGVYAMIVHAGDLYAATSASHGPQPNTMDFGRVYRYLGGTQWEDLGQPGSNYRLNSLASYWGKLYVAGFNIGPDPGHVYVYEGKQSWREVGEFLGWPHTLTVHDGNLYTAYPKGEVFAFDGDKWHELGNPFGSSKECNQIHSMGVHRGELFVGTWPKGRIAIWRDGRWVDRGIPGDSTEVIAFANYRGSLYAGTIPRAEVFRRDGNQWTSLRRLFDPPGFEPVPVGSKDWAGVSDWSRATSLAVYDGKLFASTGTCHRTTLEKPLDDEPRGRVFSYEGGAGVTYDRDLAPGWRFLTATRSGGLLSLYVDGQLAAQSAGDRAALDAASRAPLKIGFGSQAYFAGKIREVRLYDRAIGADEVEALFRSSAVVEIMKGQTR